MDIIEQFQNRRPSPIYHQEKCSNNSTVTVVPIPTFGYFGSSTSPINLTTQPSPAISPSSFSTANHFFNFKKALIHADSHLLSELGSVLFRMAEATDLLHSFEESSLDSLLQRLESNLETSNKLDEPSLGETLQNTVSIDYCVVIPK